MTILIPAFEPNENMLVLLSELINRTDQRIVVVDDGSGNNYRSLFDRAEAMGCTVLRHPENQGKGAALKTGFRWILEYGEEEGVVCADCDGQHSCEDIDKIARMVKQNPGNVVLGSRRFTGNVPLRSRMGNTITRYAFSLATAIMLCNYCFMVVFTEMLKLALVPAKLITECVLYFASYWVQKKFIFRTVSK